MRITIVVGAFPIISETFIVNQIKALIDEGYSVKIYALRKGDTSKTHKVIQDYKLLNKVTYKPSFPKNKIKRISFFFNFIFWNLFLIDWRLLVKSVNIFKYGKKALNLKLFYECQWLMYETKPDIIHVHFGVNAVSIAEFKKKGFLGGSKFIVSFHGYDMNPSKIDYYKIHYKTLFKQLDRITVNTIYLKNILLKVNPTIENIDILPVGLDTKLFQKRIEKNKSTKSFTIVFCGRLIKLKGADKAILIIQELLKRGFENINLEIIGEGELKNKLEELILENDLERFVFLKGKQSQEEIINLFDNANAFLLPGIKDPVDGRCEAQGLVIQEAQAMELPVIISDVGGMKYGVLAKESGFIIKENDISGFADAIQNLIENPTMAKFMGEKGKEFVKQNYDSKKLVKRLVSIYKQ